MRCKICFFLPLLLLVILVATGSARKCPNRCFPRFSSARSQCRTLSRCRVRRCQGRRIRWKCGVPARRPRFSVSPSPRATPASCGPRALFRGSSFALGCVCANDALSVVLQFGVVWNGSPSCVGNCVAKRIVDAEICGTGVAPTRVVVRRVVTMGYASCCARCGGKFDVAMKVCRMVWVGCGRSKCWNARWCACLQRRTKPMVQGLLGVEALESSRRCFNPPTHRKEN